MLSPFRRLRPRPAPLPLALAPDDDTDDSSPERVRPRPSPGKAARKSLERRVAVPESEQTPRGASEKLAHTTLLDDPIHVCQPALRHSDPDQALQPPAKSTLIRRVTSKLHISIPSKPSLHSRPSTRSVSANADLAAHPPRPPRAKPPLSPTLPNGFVSKEHREAALRERGLRPPRKDLSEQEREADERLGSFPSPSSVDGSGVSEAERLKTTWLAKNRSFDSGNSDLAPSVPPHLHDTPIGPQASRSSPALSDSDLHRRSIEGRSPSLGRPSISSSVPPLSSSSCLEVLHEEPSEQPPLSPANVPIIVSSPIDSPGPVFVESPVSCTFSSHHPGSIAESLSQSDHSRIPENGETRRGRRSISSGSPSPRRMGSSLSRAGSRSLSNIRRSVVGTLGLPSSTTLSSTDLPPSPTLQAPRAAISPTIHNIGSIIREARDIADDESRRLCELAFLD